MCNYTKSQSLSKSLRMPPFTCLLELNTDHSTVLLLIKHLLIALFYRIAAERFHHKVDVISMVKYYLDAALVGMTRGGSCSKVFPCVHSTTFFRYFPVAAALGSNGQTSMSGNRHPSSTSHKTTVTPTSPSPLAVPFQDRTKTIKLNIN